MYTTGKGANVNTVTGVVSVNTTSKSSIVKFAGVAPSVKLLNVKPRPLIRNTKDYAGLVA